VAAHRFDHRPCPSTRRRSREKGGDDDQALGRSRGGFSTKVHVAVDGLGNPTRLILTAGQAADVTRAEELVADQGAAHVIADKGYDSDKLVATIEAAGAVAVIPPRSNRKEPRDYDRHLYKARNLVERFINRVKQCRRVATRYDKTARNYLAFWQLASIMVLLA
jgi:transposase